jgi:hypothetical protein
MPPIPRHRVVRAVFTLLSSVPSFDRVQERRPRCNVSSARPLGRLSQISLSLAQSICAPPFLPVTCTAGRAAPDLHRELHSSLLLHRPFSFSRSNRNSHAPFKRAWEEATSPERAMFRTRKKMARSGHAHRTIGRDRLSATLAAWLALAPLTGRWEPHRLRCLPMATAKAQSIIAGQLSVQHGHCDRGVAGAD